MREVKSFTCWWGKNKRGKFQKRRDENQKRKGKQKGKTKGGKKRKKRVKKGKKSQGTFGEHSGKVCGTFREHS
jgi:hypothetical protein